MSNLLNDFFGHTYDTGVPSFVTINEKLVLHRPTRRLLDRVALNASFADASYTPSPQEMGPSPDWLMAHYGFVGEEPVESTSATAGTPGTFDEDAPADLTELQGLGALGNTDAWEDGQYIILSDGSEAYWDGSDWAEGRAPLETPVTVVVSGGGTIAVDFTFAGGDAPDDGTVTVTGIAVDTTDIDDPAVVNYSEGDSAEDVATAVAAAVNGLQDDADVITVSASATGAVVSLTNDSAGAGLFDADPSVVIA